MKILVIGSGGREHALAWALSRDPDVRQIYAAPGNPGMAEVAICVSIAANDIVELVEFAQNQKIDLTVVGPEAPLALGIVDLFQERGLRIFGPNKDASRIESSKSFTKSLFDRFYIPTPRWEAFDDLNEAIKALERFDPPWVIKADGLAAGKGVTVTNDRQEAVAAVEQKSRQPPGRIILEEFIDGWETSFTCAIRDFNVVAQWQTWDYKRLLNGDQGPLTGGMGAVVLPESELS